MKKPKAPRSVTVVSFTTITIIFWIFYSLYVVLTSKPELDIPPEILEPISPSIDVETLTKLEGRIHFEKDDITSSFVVVSPTPSPLPTQEEAEDIESQPSVSSIPTP